MLFDGAPPSVIVTVYVRVSALVTASFFMSNCSFRKDRQMIESASRRNSVDALIMEYVVIHAFGAGVEVHADHDALVRVLVQESAELHGIELPGVVPE